MNIHEYQGKQLLKGYGLPVADGVAIMSAGEAEAAAKKLPGPLYVVKSQIHAGGRGKGKFKELGPDAKGDLESMRDEDFTAESWPLAQFVAARFLLAHFDNQLVVTLVCAMLPLPLGLNHHPRAATLRKRIDLYHRGTKIGYVEFPFQITRYLGLQEVDNQQLSLGLNVDT